MSTEGKLNECIRLSLYDYPNYLKVKIYKPDLQRGNALYLLYANNFMKGRELFRGGNPKKGPIHYTVRPVYGRENHK
jgi:hypothetical protein